MSTAIVEHLPIVGSEGRMKKLRTGCRKLAAANKGKLTEFSVDNGILTVEVEGEEAFEMLCKQLQRFAGLSVTVVADAIEELLHKYGEGQKKAE